MTDAPTSYDVYHQTQVSFKAGSLLHCKMGVLYVGRANLTVIFLFLKYEIEKGLRAVYCTHNLLFANH